MYGGDAPEVVTGTAAPVFTTYSCQDGEVIGQSLIITVGHGFPVILIDSTDARGAGGDPRHATPCDVRLTA